MNLPDCTVIIPTRNCAAYLPLALQSVRTQDGIELEVIVVDDGSTDNSAAILQAFAASWPELRVIETSGVGPSSARNAAIAVARAPRVAFLDADDFWWPGKLARQLAIHRRHPKLAFSFTDYLHVDEQNRSLGTCFQYWQPRFLAGAPRDSSFFNLVDAEAELLAINSVGTSTVVADLRALQNANGFATGLSSAEDWATWLKLAASGEVMACAAIGTTYLVRSNSVSRRHADRLQSLQTIVRGYRPRAEPAIRRALRSAETRLMAARAEMYGATGRPINALGWRMRALFNTPNKRNLRDTIGGLSALIKSSRAA
jgi:glycosyltransferase involved in cell wall biosynthesis